MAKRFKMKTVADVLRWEPFLEDDQIEAFKNIACPARIGGRSVPQSLDDISLGSLFDLETIGAEKGVFAAGEILDVDGDCGGYNLQWAWSSAFCVAEAIQKYNGGAK